MPMQPGRRCSSSGASATLTQSLPSYVGRCATDERCVQLGFALRSQLLVVGTPPSCNGRTSPENRRERRMFADDYPRFIELSELTPEGQDGSSASERQRSRMNERYEALFASNRDIFDGARVLDLASHDGRYSFAALKTGAAHVIGVEVRQSLIDRAQEAFAFYGQDPATYRFICGDVFEVLEREKFDVDVVLCLGFLYHTYRHTELMYRINKLAPSHLIVDTMVTRETRQPILKVIHEQDVGDSRSAAKDPFALGRVL